MWNKSYQTYYKNIKKEAIWNCWIDVNNWPKWDKAIKYCRLEGGFKNGKTFILKPLKGPKVIITLSNIIPNKQFKASTRLLGATLNDEHRVEEGIDGVSITRTLSLTGFLSWFWIYFIGNKMASSALENQDAFVKYVRVK